MAKKNKWTEPKAEEVKEEIVVEETIVAEPEPEPEPTPEPEPEPEPVKAPEPDKDGNIFVGIARGRKLYQDSEGNRFFKE